MRTHVWITLLVLVALAPVRAISQEDHPLFSRYEGSTVASRMADEGHGVGPLAPVASSAEPAARAKNPRVELVAR